MGVVPMPADFGAFANQSFTISSFRLQIGAVMPQAKVAYETYCRLAADGRNAALITHGYTQQPSRGRVAILQTAICRVGGTGCVSVNPRTGKPCGSARYRPGAADG
jgi:hypothetical protein